MKPWHLYLVRTAAGHLYTGVTTDVARRFAEHQAGAPKGARSLRGKGPLSLAYAAAVGNRSDALRLERQIKRWSRQRKEHLISGDACLPALPSGGSDKAGRGEPSSVTEGGHDAAGKDIGQPLTGQGQ
ncbi:GIY-YIG nuclease family protein [Marinobacter sp. SS21]|uniref:GIY-YIG nuclease family protein n=1 Tax=Marinobacter sp. SS21 TaxID=2979460 RepID=UPI003FA5A1DE